MDDSKLETRSDAESDDDSNVENVDTESDTDRDTESDTESDSKVGNVTKTSMKHYYDRVGKEKKIGAKTSTGDFPYLAANWSYTTTQEELEVKTKKMWIIVLICLIGLLIFVAGLVIIIVLVLVSNISAELKLVHLTSPSIDTILTNFANISRLLVNVKLLENNIERRYENELGILSELNIQLNANVTRLVHLAMKFQSSLSNITTLDNVVKKQLENFSYNTSSQVIVFNRIIDEANENVSLTQAGTILEVLNNVGFPFTSCAAIMQEFPLSSGNYYFRSSSGSTFKAYCDMTRSCGGITGGWIRFADLDMSNISNKCPASLRLLSSPRRACIGVTADPPACYITRFAVNSFNYSKVCGRIIGYQFGNPRAFYDYPNINTLFVDGVALTYGKKPRKHIWSFSAAYNEDRFFPQYKCPCINTGIANISHTPPSFVEDDYFCDTGRALGTSKRFFPDNPLWDGAGCGPYNTCCTFNNPPWFFKELLESTTDDIEMFACNIATTGNTAIEIVEIYVQ